MVGKSFAQDTESEAWIIRLRFHFIFFAGAVGIRYLTDIAIYPV